jgi:ribonuclease-3
MDLRSRLRRARRQLPTAASSRTGRRPFFTAVHTLSSRLPNLVAVGKLRGRLHRQSVASAIPTTGMPVPRPAAVVTDEQRMRSVELAVGWEFDDQELLRDALTHRSYLNETAEHRPSNERLEFLGDSVLGLIVTDFLYGEFPDLNEGELTNIRSALVRTEALAGFARDINLGANIFVGRGEELNRGRFRPGGLACAFEALLGAVYLDKGYDSARDFALRSVQPALDDVFQLRLHKNGKSTLQEIIQSRRQLTPSYHVVREVGPDHDKSFTVEVRVGEDVLGRGIASNKRSAEQLAAQDALEALQVDA